MKATVRGQGVCTAVLCSRPSVSWWSCDVVHRSRRSFHIRSSQDGRFSTRGRKTRRSEGIQNRGNVRSPGNPLPPSLSLCVCVGIEKEGTMRDLKSLQQEFPGLNDDFLEFCASHCIYSLEDFLLHDLYALVGFAECQASSAELKQGITQVLSIIDSQHEPWLNGIELLEDQQNKHVLSTGLEGIDSLLEGGFCEGKFIELVGSSSSGKTQVCLAAVAHIAHKYMCTVMFLDTCCSFSSKRIACHINSLLKLLPKEDKERCFITVMNNILCRPVLDIIELSKVLHQMESTLASQVKDQHTKMRLLIVDSVSSLIAPILGRNPTGHSAMVSIGYLLKRLAIQYNIAVLVTNHMVGGERGILKPALGESWKRMPHIRLLLSREPGDNICSVSILKHTSVALGRTATFTFPEG